MRWWRAYGWCCLLLWPVWLWAAPVTITERALLVDGDGSLRLSQAVAGRFQPADMVLARGYTPSVSWLRLTLHNDARRDVLLRVLPVFVDDVRLYWQDASGHWQQQRGGDRQPYAARSYGSLIPSFLLPQLPAGRTLCYLRVQTSSSTLLYATAQTLLQAQQDDVWQGVVQAFYLTLLLTLLLWSLADFYRSRDAVVGCFIVYQLVAVLYHLCMLGYVALWVPQDWPQLADSLTSWSVLLLGAAGMYFHRRLLLDIWPVRWLQWLFVLLQLWYLTLLGLLAAGQAQLALQLNTASTLPMAVLGVGLAWRVPRHPLRPTLRMVYTLSLLVILYSMLPLLGLGKAEGYSQYVTLRHALVTALLAFALLFRRSLLQRLRQQRLALRLELTRQQVSLERAQREEDSRFLAMLTHELKTPLAVVRMAVGRLQQDYGVHRSLQLAENAVIDINAVIERCLQADRLQQDGFAPQQRRLCLSTLLREVQASSREPQRVRLAGDDAQNWLHSDVQLLRIVCANLLDNALKYSPPDSEVWLTLAQEGDGVSLLVDNAPGSAGQPDPAQVFCKYYRSPGAHSKTGSGLGLYLVHSLCTLLQGRIRYRPAANLVRFELWLPATTR